MSVSLQLEYILFAGRHFISVLLIAVLFIPRAENTAFTQ